MPNTEKHPLSPALLQAYKHHQPASSESRANMILTRYAGK
ncbi:hypothetical protein Z947_4028 [Sulfitobacter geojensis]|jgi:hypothetical protein|nr:hypothetical protein Z947_4028 [Sulfitobacter geojensis]NYI27650.1 hypothetical protein [Sulfitobacter geojensis]